MAALENAKHEAFAQNLAKGMNQEEAYREAGYRGDRTAASRLSTNVNIQGRVAEMQERAAHDTVTTIESLIKEGWSIITAAKSDKQHAAASQTLERIAKLAGLWVDKTESKNDSTVTVIDAQAAERARESFMRLGGAGPVSSAGASSASLPH